MAASRFPSERRAFLNRQIRKIEKKTGKKERWLEMTGNVPYYANNFYFDAVFPRTVVGEDTRLKSSTIMYHVSHYSLCCLNAKNDRMQCDNWPGAGRWTAREAST